MLKLVINSLIGGAVILIINAAAAGLGIMIPFKYAQCLILGVLGLPRSSAAGASPHKKLREKRFAEF